MTESQKAVTQELMHANNSQAAQIETTYASQNAIKDEMRFLGEGIIVLLQHQKNQAALSFTANTLAEPGIPTAITTTPAPPSSTKRPNKLLALIHASSTSTNKATQNNYPTEESTTSPPNTTPSRNKRQNTLSTPSKPRLDDPNHRPEDVDVEMQQPGSND